MTLAVLEQKLDKENFIEHIFAAESFGQKIRFCLQYATVPAAYRIRILTYAAAPGCWRRSSFSSACATG
jgi:hypothetical protein